MVLLNNQNTNSNRAIAASFDARVVRFTTHLAADGLIVSTLAASITVVIVQIMRVL